MFRTGQPKFTRLVLGLSLSAVLAVAVSGCGGGGGGGGNNGGGGFTVTGIAETSTGAAIPNATIQFRADTPGATAVTVGTTTSTGSFSIAAGGGSSPLFSGAAGLFVFTPSGAFQEFSVDPVTVPSTGNVGTLICSTSPPPPPTSGT